MHHPEGQMKSVPRWNMRHAPEIYDIPRPKLGHTLSWLTAFAIAALVIGATLVLIVAGQSS
jgi:hypothetical protein